MVLLTLIADLFLCLRFSLFIIRNFGDMASHPNRKLYIFVRRLLRGFVPFLAAWRTKRNARFQLPEDEV